MLASSEVSDRPAWLAAVVCPIKGATSSHALGVLQPCLVIAPLCARPSLAASFDGKNMTGADAAMACAMARGSSDRLAGISPSLTASRARPDRPALIPLRSDAPTTIGEVRRSEGFGN